MAKYVGEHILPVLTTQECQTVKEVIGLLDKKYGRTSLKKLEELVSDCLKFRGNDFDDEDDFIQAMEKIQMRRYELKVIDSEWFSVWMLQEAQKRKDIEQF